MINNINIKIYPIEWTIHGNVEWYVTPQETPTYNPIQYFIFLSYSIKMDERLHPRLFYWNKEH